MSEETLKVDIGCGKNTYGMEGYVGLDITDFGQKYIHDVKQGLPFEDNSVDEVYTRYFIPTLTDHGGLYERAKFYNELHRVMKDNASCTIVVPNWNSAGGYGNPTFQEPLYEGSLYFLNKEWRELNAPECTMLSCNFNPTWGYNMNPNIQVRNLEYQQFALSNYSNAATEIMITLKKCPEVKS